MIAVAVSRSDDIAAAKGALRDMIS